jgi:hypothetical protein
MDNQQTFLANLVCTRISHDLGGNIGAITAALELAGDNGNCVLDADTHNILTSAAETLKIRQKFFRLTFGLDSISITPAELTNLCQDYLNTLGNRSSKLDFECNNISANLAKIICLCIMIGAEICIKGGHIKIHIGGNKLTIDVTSDYKLAAAKISCYEALLSGKNDIENASQFVQMIYLRSLLDTEVPININSSEKTMTLIIG